jgi:hypothetical protein
MTTAHHVYSGGVKREQADYSFSPNVLVTGGEELHLFATVVVEFLSIASVGLRCKTSNCLSPQWTRNDFFGHCDDPLCANNTEVCCTPNPVCTVSDCTGSWTRNANVALCAAAACAINSDECCDDDSAASKLPDVGGASTSTSPSALDVDGDVDDDDDSNGDDASRNNANPSDDDGNDGFSMDVIIGGVAATLFSL